MLTVDWTRPEALVLLALPLVLLALGLRRGRPSEVPTGTFELWLELAGGSSPQGDRARPRPPAWLWCTAGGLAALVVAAAGPVRPEPPAPRRWEVVVEPGAALTLPFVDADGRSDGTRLDRALDRAEAWLAERLEDGDEVRWRLGARQVGAGREAPRGALGSRALRTAEPLAPGSSDRPGRLLLLARRPDPAPRSASWIAVGGGAVPGPVAPALDEAGRPVARRFDGVEVVAVGPSTGRVELDPACPPIVADVVRAWARSRALTAGPPRTDGAPEVWLSVTAFEPDDPGPHRATRDGWSATIGPDRTTGERLAPAPDGARMWLDGDGNPLVIAAAGRLGAAALEWTLPTGPPAAFALSFAALLDPLALPPPGHAPVAARVDQGPPGRGLGAPPVRLTDRPRSLAAPPALASTLLLVAAGVLLGRRLGAGPAGRERA